MHSVTRRTFLKTVTAAAAGGVLTPGLMADETTDAVSGAANNLRPDLWIIKGSDPARMLETAIARAGGWSALLRPGMRVTLKPNAAWASKPEEGGNTHPALTEAFTRGALAAGAAQVVVCENTCSPSEQAFEMSGIGPAVTKAGGRIYSPKQDSHFRRVSIPKGKALTEAEVTVDALDCDCLVNMPVAKHHGSATLTICMKNWMGSVRDRGQWHRTNLHQCIADFSTFIRPTLNIVDATRIMTTNGPRGPGKLLYPNLLIVGRDPVACDAYAATLFGLEPFTVPYIRIAHEMGVGQGDLSKVNLVTVEI